MKTTREIIFQARFVLATLSAAAISPIHASENPYDKQSLFNRVTIHYDSSVASKFPIAIKHTAMKWNEEFQMHQAVSEIDPRSSRSIKNYLMPKQYDASSSLFSVHVPCSDKKIELIAAEDGDHYFVSYVADGKECYLCIGRENPRIGVTNYEFCKFSLLTIPHGKN
jgi:hypothetical protein